MSIFTGSGVAIITPFTKSGVDFDKLKELLEKEIDCEIVEATSPGYFKGY